MLDGKLLHQYIVHPDLLGTEDVRILRESLELYPFCHITRMLYLKALHNTDNFSYPAELSRGAAYIADRRALFELVNPTEPGADTATQLKANGADRQGDAPQELSQWMDGENGTGKNTEEIIDRFIRTNPRIKPASDEVAADRDLSSAVSEVVSTQVMTETLARIYVRQKKYDRAVEAYRILMLKNPKKSSFFADRIKELENLRDKN